VLEYAVCEGLIREGIPLKEENASCDNLAAFLPQKRQPPRETAAPAEEKITPEEEA